MTGAYVYIVAIWPPLLAAAFLALIALYAWRRPEVGADGSVVLSYALPGAAFVAYGLGLLLRYAGVFLRLFSPSPRHRWPVPLVQLGQLASRTAFLLDIAHGKTWLPFVSPWGGYKTTPTTQYDFRIVTGRTVLFYGRPLLLFGAAASLGQCAGLCVLRATPCAEAGCWASRRRTS